MPPCHTCPLFMHAPYHTCPLAMHAPLPCMTRHHTPPAMHDPLCTPPLPCMPPLLPCMPPFVTHALPCGQNDRCLWKHDLSATTVADGNYALMPLLHRHNKTFINHLFLHIFIHDVFVYIFISLIECFAEAFSKSFNETLTYSHK